VLVATLLLAIGLHAAASPPAPDPPPRDGEALIRRMRERYDGKWYRTLTFVQKTTLPNGEVETWHEALSAPGLLRIDIAPLDSMHTLIFRDDSLYVFKAGHLTESRDLIHPLLVLGFDVYVQPESVTIGKLRGLGYDLSRLHETTWQGRPTWVAGALPGDSTSRQFWIDKERLYFVRSLEPSPQNPAVTMGDPIREVPRDGRGMAGTRGGVPRERPGEDAGGVSGDPGGRPAGRGVVPNRSVGAAGLDPPGAGQRGSARRVRASRSSRGRGPPPRNSQWAGSQTRTPGGRPRRSPSPRSCSASSQAGIHSPAVIPG
jgi:hypothetical protein